MRDKRESGALEVLLSNWMLTTLPCVSVLALTAEAYAALSEPVLFAGNMSVIFLRALKLYASIKAWYSLRA